MSKHGHSEACCSVPTVEADYNPKGKYIDVDGTKIYQTGPSSAKTGVFMIMDIFGFSNQLLQGADILAHADDEHHQYQVFLPDPFNDKPFSKSNFPPDTDEKKQLLNDFFSGPANMENTIKWVNELVPKLKEQHNVEKFAGVGYCWGGKVISMTSKAGTPFAAGAECHPAFVDAGDAKEITIPICMLASQDEDADGVKKFEEALTVPKHVEIFSDQVHGWMAARGDLNSARPKEEYQRGYRTLLDFFHKHI